MLSSKRVHFSSVRTSKLQLAAEQSSTGGCWNPLKKDNLHSRTKEKPQDCREGGNHVKIKSYTHQRLLEDTNKILSTPGTRGTEQWLLQETEPYLPMTVWGSPAEASVSMGLPWGQGHWYQQSREVQHIGISPLGGGHHYPYHRAAKWAICKLENSYTEEALALL